MANRAVWTGVACALAAALVASGAGRAAAQGKHHTMSLEKMTRSADVVFVGVVQSIKGRWTTNRFGDRVVVSDVNLKVKEGIKGKLNSPSAKLEVEGGKVGDDIFAASDAPTFKKGEQVVVFGKGSAARLRIVGGLSGRLRIGKNGVVSKLKIPLMRLKKDLVRFVPANLRSPTLKLDVPLRQVPFKRPAAVPRRLKRMKPTAVPRRLRRK